MDDSGYITIGALGALALWAFVRASRKNVRSLARLEAKNRLVMRQITDADAEANARAQSRASASGNVVHVHVNSSRKRRRAPK